MKLAPDIVIAGFPKSGTTTLAEQLSRMPEIEFFIKGKKEPHTFLFEPYSARYKEKMGCASKILLDASTGYSVFPEPLERIAKLNGQALVVFILRDPIERTHSHVSWLRKVEKRTIPFDMQENVVGLRSKNLYTRKGNYLSSLAANHYAETILHAKKHFSKVMIVYFDDLVNNQIKVLNEIRHNFNLPALDQRWQPIASNVTSEQSYQQTKSTPITFANLPKKAMWALQNLRRFLFQEVWLRVRFGVKLCEHDEERFQGKEDEIYNLIRSDVAKYTEAGIDLTKFPTLNQWVKHRESARS